jgi:hypothetical protein
MNYLWVEGGQQHVDRRNREALLEFPPFSRATRNRTRHTQQVSRVPCHELTSRSSLQMQLGARLGGAYANNVVWDGTSTAVTAGATCIRRIGHIGQQPISLDTGLGFTRVHSEFDTGGIVSTTQYLPYISERVVL